MKRRIAFLLPLVCAVVLASAGSALAASPGQAAYSGVGAAQVSQAQGAEPASTSTSSEPTLPFTGLDLGLLTVVAVTLTGVGLVIRRTVGTTDD